LSNFISFKLDRLLRDDVKIGVLNEFAWGQAPVMKEEEDVEN
jgi:hypothetical protein